MKHAYAFAFAALLGCSGALPTWEQAGLAGAVRPEMGGPQPGSVAPSFDALTSLRGSWVVLHFTASWCPYCDSEVAHLGELADAYASRGVRVVLIDEKEDEARWRAYAAAHVSPHVISLRDPDGAIALAYAPPRAQPSFADRSQVALDSTLIIDPEGAIRLFLLPDTAHFDPTFVAVRRELDRMLAADVVRVSLAARGCAVVATIAIAPGYHVQSHEPSEPQFIRTELVASTDEVELDAPRYAGGGTYAGTTSVVVPCKGAGSARPQKTIVTVSYQACTSTRCLFPTKRRVETLLSLADNRGTP